MSRLYLALFCTACILTCPSSARAQVKDAFIQGVADFVNAANGTKGDEGPALSAAIDDMAAGLAQWDAAVAKVEAGLASQIGGAPPSIAARMRATLGAVYLERGRLEAALEQFDRALQLDPQVRDVQLLRGLAYQRTNRPADAQTAFRAALQQEPGNAATAYLFLHAGEGADAEGKSDAMRILSEAVDSAPTVDRPQFMVLSFLDDASASAPVFVPTVYGDAATHLVQANYAEAIASLKRAATAESLAAARDERARLADADARMESRDPAGARAALEEAIRAFPNSGTAHWKLGRLLEALGDEPAALRSFRAAASLPCLGGAAHLYARIGRIHHNQLDLESAASAYGERVDLTPNDAAAHVDLGDVYRAQDRLDEALAEYLMALLLDPANVKAVATAAQVHAAAGRDEPAVRLLRRAVAMDSAHLEARYALSRALMRLGQTEEARRELAVFEQLQQKALADQRRRFEENQIKIEETLKAGDRKEPAR